MLNNIQNPNAQNSKQKRDGIGNSYADLGKDKKAIEDNIKAVLIIPDDPIFS